jgi:hypothetical protein
MRFTKLQWFVFGLCLLSTLVGLAVGFWVSPSAERAEAELESCVWLWESCRSRLARACDPCLWPRFNTQHIGEMEWCEGVATAGVLPCPEPIEEQQ